MTIIAKNIQEISEKLEFTDSIITSISWENNLFDLVLIVEYFWDITETQRTSRNLKITFKKCTKAFFQTTSYLANLPIPESEVRSYSYSWFTITLFKWVNPEDFLGEREDHDLIQVDIYTTEHDDPWLSTQSKEVIVEEV